MYVLPGTYGHFQSPAKTEKTPVKLNYPFKAMPWITYSSNWNVKKKYISVNDIRSKQPNQYQKPGSFYIVMNDEPLMIF